MTASQAANACGAGLRRAECHVLRPHISPARAANARICARRTAWGMLGLYGWRGDAVVGVRRSARADRAVSQARPVMMLARWNSPPRLTSRGDWPKPAPARVMAASMVTAVPALAGPPGPPGTGECGRGQADEHRDSRQIMCGAGTAGLGERIGCSGRVATDRVSGEHGRADKPRACGTDQRRCSPAAGRAITGPGQACGPGQHQRPGHREVPSLDPAARPERQRTDWVAQRPVTIPDSALKQEHRDKNRACGDTTAQQPAGPGLRQAGDAGRAHQRSLPGQPLPPAGCSVPESVDER